VVLTRRAIAAAALLLVVVVLVPRAVTVGACLLALLAAVALDVALATPPRHLTVERELPRQVRLGETVPAALLVTNTGGRSATVRLRDAWAPSAGLADQRADLTVPAGERRRVDQVFAPRRRGDHSSAGLTLRLRGPLGLACRDVRRELPGTLRVLPEFRSRRLLPSRLRRLREIEGSAIVNRRGQGTEFDSLREYVEGDDVRSIDWRATGRRHEVVVRTWRPERDRHLTLVLDTSRLSAGRVDDQPRLDAAMDAALLLVALATRAGDRISLLCIDRVVHARLRTPPRTTALARAVQLLAPIEPALVETDWSVVAAELERTAPKDSLVVLLTPLEPSSVEHGLLPVVGRIAQRHPVVVAGVADPALERMRDEREDAREVYRAAAAELDRLERSAVGRVLGRAGVEVLEAGPGELAARLADQYLALKAAGRL
jgi:uncharacterized protein (DUF58 family)